MAQINLPRCANCFETTHSMVSGKPRCIENPGQDRAMDDEMRKRWDAATALDAQTKRMTREQP